MPVAGTAAVALMALGGMFAWMTSGA